MPHPQIKIVGETSDGKIRAIAVNPDGSLPIGIVVDNLSVETSSYQQVLNAPDYTRTIVYSGDGLRLRITAITVSSASIDETFTDTYSYEGSSGQELLVNITRSRG